MEYEIQLAEGKTKQHQVTALHLTSSLAFLGAGSIVYVYNNSIKPWGLAMLLLGVLIIVATISKNKWVTSPAPNLVIRLIEFAVSSSFAVYALVLQYNVPILIFSVLSAALLFAIYWERASNALQFVYVDKDGIRLPVTSRRRFIEWAEVSQVIIRFGTLSIDCLDNRLFQWNIGHTDFPVSEFEAFCIAQVELNKPKEIKNNW